MKFYSNLVKKAQHPFARLLSLSSCIGNKQGEDSIDGRWFELASCPGIATVFKMVGSIEFRGIPVYLQLISGRLPLQMAGVNKTGGTWVAMGFHSS